MVREELTSIVDTIDEEMILQDVWVAQSKHQICPV
jgi:hypothetical protein